MNTQELKNVAKLIRYFILTSTTKAGSGHPTSSLSSVELMTVLFFGGFYYYDLDNPDNPKNDRVIFSKGHASPLLYALYTAAGALSYDELMPLRRLDSPLEGHPTQRFKYTEAATGSLGQGLSIGLGMAMASAPYVYVLLGDGEMAEGNVWEAMEVASFYRADNLIAIVDVNRLGQSGPTMLEWNIESYRKRAEAFGWHTIVVDGHDINQVYAAYQEAFEVMEEPQMIIAKTVKGKGVSFLENKEGWHGKALKEDELHKALEELGEVDKEVRGIIARPDKRRGR